MSLVQPIIPTENFRNISVLRI